MRRKFSVLLGMWLFWHGAVALAGNSAEQIRLLQNRVQQGSPNAAMLLASAYQSGDGVTQDLARARHYYAFAAGKGDPLGQTVLAQMYENGAGGPQDARQAVRWYVAAARQHYAGALLALSSMFESGSGVKRDPETADNLMRRCAFSPVLGSYLDDKSPLACRVLLSSEMLKKTHAADQEGLRQALLLLALALADPASDEASQDPLYKDVLQAARQEYDSASRFLTPESTQFIHNSLAHREALLTQMLKALPMPAVLK